MSVMAFSFTCDVSAGMAGTAGGWSGISVWAFPVVSQSLLGTSQL